MVVSNSNQEGIKLECRCGKEWTYKGENKVYATCPDCKTSVKLAQVKE